MLSLLRRVQTDLANDESRFTRRQHMEMQARIDYSIVSGVGRAMGGLDHLVRSSALASQEPLLIELVKIRASQINGCAY